MVMVRKSLAFHAAMFLFVSHLAGQAHAYLDPGTGSLALQVILGGAVAALAAVKLYWDRVKMFVLRRRISEDAASEPR